MTFPKSVDVFCRVVDNFGDIGVCWRLARQFTTEHALSVTLWVDDLVSFKKICPHIDVQKNVQSVQSVLVRRWCSDVENAAAFQIPDVVIEAFACEIPNAYLHQMAKQKHQPFWINLEYLSAESWVEGCHLVASKHPSLALTKYFFFPGFTNKTGGLLVERDLRSKRMAFQNDPAAVSAFFADLGVDLSDAVQIVSLFCYPTAPVTALLNAIKASGLPTLCVVPEGVAQDAIAAFIGRPAKAGTQVTMSALTVHVLPFLTQTEYDKLLWACDINFVRGEDSFVRAQWAARPFVWHVYSQEDEAHLQKLDAFLKHYQKQMPDACRHLTEHIWAMWNGAASGTLDWHSLQLLMPSILEHANYWEQELLQNGDLATNLVQFIREMS